MCGPSGFREGFFVLGYFMVKEHFYLDNHLKTIHRIYQHLIFC
jgi:hypothetical protein